MNKFFMLGLMFHSLTGFAAEISSSTAKELMREDIGVICALGENKDRALESLKAKVEEIKAEMNVNSSNGPNRFQGYSVKKQSAPIFHEIENATVACAAVQTHFYCIMTPSKYNRGGVCY